jgi:hypothetical protein
LLAGSGTIICTLAAVAAGTQLDFVLTFGGTVAGVHTNTLTVTGQQRILR